MTNQDLALMFGSRRNSDEIAPNQYGDRWYGTPESTLFNDAYEKSQARIESPRWLAPGISYEGRTGNIDTPEIVSEELVSPLLTTFHPQLSSKLDQENQENAYREERQRIAREALAAKIADDKAKNEISNQRNKRLEQETLNKSNRLASESMRGATDTKAKMLVAELNAVSRGFGSGKDAALADVRKRMAEFYAKFPLTAETAWLPQPPPETDAPDVSQVQPPPFAPQIQTNTPESLEYQLINGKLQLVK